MEQSEATISTSQGRGSWTPGIGGWQKTPRRSGPPANAQHPAKSRHGPNHQKGTKSEKNGNWRPTMAESNCRSIPVTRFKAIMGVPKEPRHRRGVGNQRKSGGGQRFEAELHQNHRRHGHRRAKAGRTLKKRAKGKGDENQLHPRSGDRLAKLSRSTLNNLYGRSVGRGTSGSR